MRKATIKPEMIMKVWKLHNNRVDENLIAETLGMSLTSAKRIIKIMTAAQNGEDVDAIEGNRCQEMKDFAKKVFCIEEQKEEQHEEQHELECQTAVDEISKDYMQKMLAMLAWQNELLEQLLSSLGVDWKTFKGVERR